MNDAKSLYCTNPECQAKRIKAFALLTSRDALNVEGLSEATLEKFIARGFIHKYTDIFHLDRYQEEIQSMEGFGEKSYANLIQSIEKARETTLPKVIYSMVLCWNLTTIVPVRLRSMWAELWRNLLRK